MFVWRLQQGHQAVVLIRAATVNPVQWGQVQMLWKQAKDTWRNLLGSASRLTLGDPATILTFIPANVWRASPASDVAAADQTHCRWSVALTAVATAWQRCAFRFGEHNHNKRSWTRGLYISAGRRWLAVGWGGGGWSLPPFSAGAPCHSGDGRAFFNESVESRSTEQSACDDGVEAVALGWSAATLQVNKATNRDLNQLWLETWFDLKPKLQCSLSPSNKSIELFCLLNFPESFQIYEIKG